MTRFLLDTNVVSDFLRHHPVVTAHFRAVPPAWLAISTVTVMEIEYGLERQPGASKNYGEVRAALQTEVLVLPYEAADAVQTAKIRAQLTRLRTPIGPHDLQLAGTALARGFTLVTHDVGECSRVPGLVLEDWWQP